MTGRGEATMRREAVLGELHFILIWLCVGSGIVVVSAVAILGWLIAQSAEWIVAIAMAVTGQ
jgi:hypothetical protein